MDMQTPSTGEELRDEALAKVLREEFMVEVLAFVKATLVNGQVLTGEDVRFACEEVGVVPHHGNAWGAVIRDLKRKSLLKNTGHYVKSKDPRSHATIIPSYTVDNCLQPATVPPV